MLPTDRQIRELHRQCAPSAEAFELVHTHCLIVAEVAARLLSAGNHAGIDADLVRAGAQLHDIGVYRLYDDTGTLDYPNYIRHGVLGEALLRELGYSQELARFCSHHTGVGLTGAEVARRKLPLPPGDYLAETDEELLVMYADKFHSKTTPPMFLTRQSYAAKLRRFGDDKVALFGKLADRFGEPDLPPLSRRFGHQVV